jgi:membrane fusion protein (multidrug efflux system)
MSAIPEGEVLPAPPPPAVSPAMRRLLIGVCSVLATAVIVALIYGTWHGVTPFETTNNAYVKGDLTFIASKVGGYVVEVNVENNQRVAAGQVLARIDARDYDSTLRDTSALVAQQQAALVQIDAQEQLQHAQIRIAKAAVASANAPLRKAREEFTRASALVDEGGVSRAIYDQAMAEKVRTESALEQARAQALFAHKQLAVLAAQRQAIKAALQGAEAKQLRARNDLEATAITSPREGVVAGRNVRLGEFVSAATRLLAIAPTQDLWIEANLRETQLSRVRPGDRVRVEVDAIRDIVYCGTVESIGGASAAEYALLPPDNATGNFTKIVRRFPVRILLDEAQPGLDRLAGGMSVEPMIAIGSHTDGRTHRGLVGWLFGPFGCESPGEHS